MRKLSVAAGAAAWEWSDHVNIILIYGPKAASNLRHAIIDLGFAVNLTDKKPRSVLAADPTQMLEEDRFLFECGDGKSLVELNENYFGWRMVTNEISNPTALAGSTMFSVTVPQKDEHGDDVPGGRFITQALSYGGAVVDAVEMLRDERELEAPIKAAVELFKGVV